jgi:hypothetical protein
MKTKTRKTTYVALVAAALSGPGCATTTIEPGHRGLYFAPNAGGLRREVLQPGKYPLGWCFIYCTPNRVDDFDVTYSTHAEDIHTKSVEGLDLGLKLSVIYRPIVSELISSIPKLDRTTTTKSLALSFAARVAASSRGIRTRSYKRTTSRSRTKSRPKCAGARRANMWKSLA